MTLGLFDAIDDAAAFADTIAELHDVVDLEPEPDDEPDDDAPVVRLILLDDGRTISVNEKGHWRDAAGRKIVPIRGARAWCRGEQKGDILCPDCSSPARWGCGSWHCPNGTHSHKFCGGLTIPAVRRARNTIKWRCLDQRCLHEWKTRNGDDTPERCPECNQPTVRFVKRTSR